MQPSRVADILMEQGRQAARARELQGQIWGGMAERLGQLPSEAIQQQQQLTQQKQTAAIRGEQLKQFERVRQGQELAKSLYAQHTSIDDAGHQRYNDEAITNGFRAAGFDDLADHHLDIGMKLEDHIANTQIKKAAFDASVQKTYADAYGTLLSLPAEKRAEAYPVWREALRAKGQNDPVFGALQETYPGDDAFKAQYESHRTNAERLAERKEAAEEARKDTQVLGYGAKAVYIDPTTHQATTLAEGAPDPFKGVYPVAPGGKLERWDPEKGAMTTIAEGGPPPGAADKERHEAETERLARQREAREAASAASTIRHQRFEESKADAAPNQSKLEQQYRTVLQRAMSSRSGGLGMEDAKVQQANHLLALLHQTYDPKTGTHNIPKVLQGELAAGLARLVAPGGNVGIEMMREFNQRTAKGDLAGAITYITGQPVSSTPEAIARMLKDSIERQGKVAEENREGEMRYLRGLAPTELDEERRQKLETTSLNPLRLSRVIQNQKTGERKLQVSIDGGKTWQ